MRIVDKKKFARFICIIVAAILLVGFVVRDQYEIIGYEIYAVESGDTLWEIAEMSNGYDNIDTRRIICDMREASDLETSSLQVGEIIKIPMYE